MRKIGCFRTKKNAWALGLALFSLGLQILIPLTQALAASAAGDGASNQVWICTLYGFKPVSNNPGEEPTKHSKADCPTCLAYAIGMASLNNASEIVLPVPPSARADNIVFANTARFGFEVPSNYLTRAPPFSI
ncbi:MAG: hypothetical protein P8Y67_00940 [Alphaproteobacteria bacterium]